MKYLKLYEENIENKPKIGDYVICEESLDNITKEFISNNIGKIIGIESAGLPGNIDKIEQFYC